MLINKQINYLYIYTQDTLKDFLEKREHGQLLYQKRTTLEQTIFKQVSMCERKRERKRERRERVGDGESDLHNF